MADVVSTKLPKQSNSTPLAFVDNTLEGQPGDEITVPKWEYAGDAADVAEGVAITLDQLTTKKSKMTIKRQVKVTKSQMKSFFQVLVIQSDKQYTKHHLPLLTKSTMTL